MTKTPFLIVCAASSGSTLLSLLLDKHPDLAIGPELGIFNKKVTFNSFSKYKKNISKYLRNGTSTCGQVENSIYFDNLESYFWNKNEILDKIQSTNSHREFFDTFFQRFLEKRGKKIWGEKTGSNAYYIKQFLKIYPNAKIIHLTRHPYDAINSIIKRTLKEKRINKKHAIYHATSHWLYNNIASYRIRNQSNYMNVSYETLVENPKETLNIIQNHLEIPIHDLIETNNEFWENNVDNKNTHQSWNANPFGKITTSSIGKGKAELSNEAKELIANLKLTHFAKIKLKINNNYNIPSLAKELGYKMDIDQNNYSVNSDNQIKIKDIFKYEINRMIRGYRRHKIVYLPLFTKSIIRNQ